MALPNVYPVPMVNIAKRASKSAIHVLPAMKVQRITWDESSAHMILFERLIAQYVQGVLTTQCQTNIALHELAMVR